MSTIDSFENAVKKDIEDKRDFIKEIPENIDLSKTVNLLDGISYNVRNQGSLNACTGFAASSFFSILNTKLVGKWIAYSPFFTWYKSKEYWNEQDENVGVYPRDLMKSMKEFGILPEAFTKMSSSNLTPNKDDLKWASKNKIKSYFRIPNDNIIKGIQHSIINERIPVLASIMILDKLWKNCNRTGTLDYSEGSIHTGNHMVCVYGWDSDKEMFRVLNSHGYDFGNNGSFFMTPRFTEKCVNDAWTVGYNYF